MLMLITMSAVQGMAASDLYFWVLALVSAGLVVLLMLLDRHLERVSVRLLHDLAVRDGVSVAEMLCSIRAHKKYFRDIIVWHFIKKSVVAIAVFMLSIMIVEKVFHASLLAESVAYGISMTVLSVFLYHRISKALLLYMRLNSSKPAELSGSDLDEQLQKRVL